MGDPLSSGTPPSVLGGAVSAENSARRCRMGPTDRLSGPPMSWASAGGAMAGAMRATIRENRFTKSLRKRRLDFEIAQREWFWIAGTVGGRWPALTRWRTKTYPGSADGKVLRGNEPTLMLYVTTGVWGRRICSLFVLLVPRRLREMRQRRYVWRPQRDGIRLRRFQPANIDRQCLLAYQTMLLRAMGH